MSSGTRGMILAAAILLFATIVAGQQTASVSLSAVDGDRSVKPANGDTIEFNISVRNTAEETQNIFLDTFVSNPGWYYIEPNSLSLGPNQTGYAVLEISPSRDAIADTDKGFTVIVRPEIGDRIERRGTFEIIRDVSIVMSSMQTDKGLYRPSETVTVEATVRNVQETEFDYNEYQVTFTLGEESDTVTVSDLDPGERATVNTSFTLGQYSAGTKTVRASVQGPDGVAEEQQAVITVETAENIQYDRSSEQQYAFRTETRSLRNIGNAPADRTNLTGTVNAYLQYFVSHSTEPTRTVTRNGTTTFIWDTGSLAPSEQRSISYTVHYWAPIAIILTILTAIAVGIYAYRRPHIEKDSVRKDGRHAVHIRVTNRSGQRLDHVSVQDQVPSIATLIEKFDSSPPEKIRKGEESTELEWLLGRMDPGEERILTYEITPQVEVEGSVKLPAADLSYEARGTEKQRSSRREKADFS